MSVCVCNRCLIFVPLALDGSMYDNPHVIREGEREMVAEGKSPDVLLVDRFSYCGPYRVDVTEKTAST